MGYWLFIGVADDVLIASLMSLTDRLVLDLEFLVFKPFVALVNCGVILLLTFISLFFPMLKIGRIKPVKIIKAKE